MPTNNTIKIKTNAGLLYVFEEWLKKQSYAINTKNTYLKTVRDFLAYLRDFNKVHLNNVSIELLLQFITKRGNKLYAPANTNLRLSALGLFFTWACKNKFCYKNPVIEYKKYRLNKKPFASKAYKTDVKLVILSSEEQLLLLNSKTDQSFLAIRDKCIISMMLDTALYAGELINLQIKDLNLENSYIEVRSDNPNKKRKIQLTTSVCKFCRAWLVQRNNAMGNNQLKMLFFTDKLKKISKRSLYRIISKAILDAGINKPHLGPEIIRQTAVHNMSSSGKTIEEVQLITGIKTLKNIQKYMEH